MTREEAINQLQDAKDGYKEFLTDEALDMAIKALEQQPCEDWYDVPSDEMTLDQARQAVKDLREKLAKYLEQQPCEDEDIAKAFQLGMAMGFGEKHDEMDRVIEEVKKAVTTEQQPCEDAISRQEVMYALCDACELFHKNGEETCLTKCESYHFLATLPSVTPKEKTGKWIDDADKIDAQFGRHTYKCSECGKYAEYFVGGTEVWWDRIKPNFCPNCGARMVRE